MSAYDSTFWSVVFWSTIVGGCVGSFLNVVVYRLPIGLSLIHPPSHCPKCGKPIAWYDNVPVLGWLILRGRCRKCHNPIAFRYPLVEAVTAAVFGVVALAELPYLISIHTFGLLPYHLLLLCTLLCAGLIEFDGNRVPWRLFVPAILVGVLAPMIWPALRSTVLPLTCGRSACWHVVLMDELVGLAIGFLLGGMAGQMLGKETSRGTMGGLICIGLFFGGATWFWLLVIAAVTAGSVGMLRLVGKKLHLPPIPASMPLGVATLLALLVFSRILN